MTDPATEATIGRLAAGASATAGITGRDEPRGDLMIDRPRRCHYAFAVKRVKGGYKVSHVLDFPSRGQADKWSLSLLAKHGDAGSITLERELVDGEVLDAATLKR
jgi:hypothetical protein